MSPRFLARCLLKELAYRLSTPPPPPPHPSNPAHHSIHFITFWFRKHRFPLKSKILIKWFEFFIWLWILVEKILPLMYLLLSLPVACSKSSVINSNPLLLPHPPLLHSDTIWRHHICDFSYPYKQFLFFLMLFVDLNECTMNTHNCNAKNYCNNTVGSFTCTCKPGFSGNGISCTGRQWYIMLSTFMH